MYQNEVKNIIVFPEVIQNETFWELNDTKETLYLGKQVGL